MEVPSMQNRNMTGADPALVADIVNHIKSKGIFDDMRKECLSDVDTKPAFQNLRQRVEGFTSNFLSKIRYRSDLNKNQLRDNLRNELMTSGMMAHGLDHLVDQVVHQKTHRSLLPKVKDAVYDFLGLPNPKPICPVPGFPFNVPPPNLRPTREENVHLPATSKEPDQKLPKIVVPEGKIAADVSQKQKSPKTVVPEKNIAVDVSHDQKSPKVVVPERKITADVSHEKNPSTEMRIDKTSLSTNSVVSFSSSSSSSSSSSVSQKSQSSVEDYKHLKSQKSEDSDNEFYDDRMVKVNDQSSLDEHGKSDDENSKIGLQIICKSKCDDLSSKKSPDSTKSSSNLRQESDAPAREASKEKFDRKQSRLVKGKTDEGTKDSKANRQCADDEDNSASKKLNSVDVEKFSFFANYQASKKEKSAKRKLELSAENLKRRKLIADMKTSEKSDDKGTGPVKSSSVQEEGNLSDVTVSSVHTSDLSSYDERISLSSGDELDLNEPCVQNVLVKKKDRDASCMEAAIHDDADDNTSDTIKMELRRQRKLNPKYTSKEFSSIFNDDKNKSELIAGQKNADGSTKNIICDSRKSSRYVYTSSSDSDSSNENSSSSESSDGKLAVPIISDDSSDCSNDESSDAVKSTSETKSKAGRPTSSTSNTSQRYQSSDLYKPRPIIQSSTRRRTSSSEMPKQSHKAKRRKNK